MIYRMGCETRRRKLKKQYGGKGTSVMRRSLGASPESGTVMMKGKRGRRKT